MKNINENILITKASGETELFDLKKLEYSLRKAGASETIISQISDSIYEWIVPGITTKEIYSKAFSLLRENDTVTHLKYRLKNAFLDLGTSGYPFEKLIGELFQRQGFECQTGVILQGCCISHEMDVIATKDQTQHIVECKYRQEQGNHISIQVPLYVNSRVNDIVERKKTLAKYQNFNFHTWVVTNTRFSKDSENYGKCKGLKLLGWDYPAGEGLKDLVEKYNLYPVSILTSISSENIQKCLNEGLVTCKQLRDNEAFLNTVGLTNSEKELVLKELDDLLKN